MLYLILDASVGGVQWQGSCTPVYKGMPKFKKEKSSMTRRLPQGILLLFVCTLALILIPVSYSAVWAQSTPDSTTQQDKTDRNDVNQDQSNPDLNQSSQPSTDTKSSTDTDS